MGLTSINGLPEVDELDIETGITHIHFGDNISTSEELKNTINITNDISSILNESDNFKKLHKYLMKKYNINDGSFSKFYDSIPKDNQTGRIISQIYRILKTIRNDKEHNYTRSNNGGKTVIAYRFKGQEFILKIKTYGLNIVESGVNCFIIYDNSQYSEKYIEALLSKYYKDVIDVIEEFQDEKGTIDIIDVTVQIGRLKRISTRVKEFEKDQMFLKFTGVKKYLNNIIGWPLDIFIDYNNEEYIIPIEVLDTNAQIKICDLNVWKIKSN